MATIHASLGEGTEVTITARGHTWKADEPLDAGGTDRGPSPYELLLGALGACTTLTLRLYARHKGIDLQGVEVEYDFDRIHAEDCKECGDDAKGLVEVIRARVRFRGSFDEAQRERLSQIVSRCPVHKTLAAGVHMFEKVAFEDDLAGSAK